MRVSKYETCVLEHAHEEPLEHGTIKKYKRLSRNVTFSLILLNCTRAIWLVTLPEFGKIWEQAAPNQWRHNSSKYNGSFI